MRIFNDGRSFVINILKDICRALSGWLWPAVMALGILAVITYPAFKVPCVGCGKIIKKESFIEKLVWNLTSEVGDGYAHQSCVEKIPFNWESYEKFIKNVD